MDLYTSSHPSLVSDRVIGSFNKLLEDARNKNIGFFQKIYDKIIYPNLGIFIVLLLIVVFLIYRYMTINKNKENFDKDLQDTGSIPYHGRIKLFDPDMDRPDERIARPTFNPSFPIEKQRSYVNYLPDEVPVDVNGQLIDNVKEQDYSAPEEWHNSFQYSGPYYKLGENGFSDDMYEDFAKYNRKNLNDFDAILQDKMNIDPTK